MRTYSYPDTVYFEHMVILSSVAEATSAPTTHTEARLAGHRSHRNRLIHVNWHRRSKSTGDAEVHFAETEPHRAWLRATLRREVYFGEAEPEEPTPQKPTPNLTRQMTVKAKAFLEAQDKRKEREDGEKAKALARHEAWVDGQIKRNSSEPKEAVRKLWREEQHALEARLQGTEDSHDVWLQEHHILPTIKRLAPADQVWPYGRAALQRTRNSEVSAFRVSTAAALWRGLVARQKDSERQEGRLRRTA